ncbi:hypothetical protein BDQ17DRAFT_1369477 [Cyathus striatus]|nr:hypothetical protein BDQ17DRAFT_1369477 [Cyathus striatus]
MDLSTNSKLPTEIVWHIIDEVALLDHIDLRTLKACSQTCKDFLHQSQRYIFRSIRFGPNRNVGKIESLHRTITSTPALSNYIRIFQISDNSKDNAILFDPLLPDLLSKLQCITTLELALFGFHHSQGGTLSTWIGFSSSLQEAVIKTLVSPSLEFFQIDGIKELPQIVAECITFIPVVRLRMITFQV